MKRSDINWITEKNKTTNEYSVDFLLRMGFIWKLESGVYLLTPMGSLFLSSLKKKISKKMNSFNYCEITNFSISSLSFWKEREYILEDAFISDNMVLHPTSEETIFYALKKYNFSKVFSYSLCFRKEKRPNFALIRSFSFIMKDAYSTFDNLLDMEEEYEKVKDLYLDIFSDLGISVFLKENAKKTECEFLSFSPSELKTDVFDNKNVVELGHSFKWYMFEKHSISFGIGVTRLLQFICLNNNLSFILPFKYAICKKTERADHLYNSFSSDDVFFDDTDKTIPEKIYDLKSLGFLEENIFVV